MPVPAHQTLEPISNRDSSAVLNFGVLRTESDVHVLSLLSMYF